MAEKIILIDSDPAFSAAAKEALAAKGYDCTTCAACAEGLAAVKEAKPALVIIDMFFAGKAEGILAARKLRRSKDFAGIKTRILMLSDLRTRAHKGFPNPSKYAYRLTIDELLFKPAKPDQLAAKAAELLAVQPR